MNQTDPIVLATPVRLRLEFALFYLVAPVAIALLVPPQRMFTVLFAVTALGIGLLHLTPGFRWADLAAGMRRIDWHRVWQIGALVFAFGAGLLWLTRPDALFELVRQRPGLMLAILLLYPIASALPQEVVFRALFFRRYDAILPDGHRARLALNAAIFSLAHLMYWSWLVALMTFAGGLAFAWAAEVRRSFPMAVLLHAVAGNVIFLVGLGLYFYSGNVVRPF